MLTLKGRFAFSSAEKANPFPGSLAFEPVGSPLRIIVVCLQDVVPPTADKVELKGRFLDSTLRGMKVFEATSVQVLQEATSIAPFTSNEREVSEQIQGVVTFLSQCFKLKTGPTVFLTLEMDSQGQGQGQGQGQKQETRLLLLQDAVQCVQYLRVGDRIEAINVTRFRWKTASTDAAMLSQTSYRMSSSSTQEDAPNTLLKCYYVDKPQCVHVLQHGVRDAGDKCNNIPCNTSHSAATTNHTISANSADNPHIPTTTIDPQSFLNPLSLLEKEVYASTELSSVVGSVRNVHPSGWIELTDVTVCYKVGGDSTSSATSTGTGNSSTSEGCSSGNAGHVHASLDIYDVDSYPNSSHSSEPPANNVIHVDTATSNTTYTIQLPYIILYLSHYTVQHLRMTALGVSVRQTATICVHNTVPIYMYGRCKGLRTTCRSNIRIVKFAASSAFVSNDPLYCSVNVNICSEYKACCVLYSVWREEVRRKIAQCVSYDFHSVCGTLHDSVVSYVESLATFNGSISSGTSGSSSASVSLSMRTVLQLSPVAVQDEIYDLNTVLLHTIRNGYDSDYIGNNMPQVYSVGGIIAKLKSMHALNEGYCHTYVYGAYVHDLCSVQLNNSYWSQYSGSKTSHVRKNIALLGSVVRVSIPYIANTSVAASVLSVNVTIVDSSGCSVAVIVNGLDSEYVQYLHTLCAAYLCKADNNAHSVCGKCHRSKRGCTSTSTTDTGSVHSTHTVYYMACNCSIQQRPPLHTTHQSAVGMTAATSNSASVISNPLLLCIHYPQGLVEKQPQLHNTNTTSDKFHRYFVTCDKADAKFIHNSDTSSTNAPNTAATNGTNTTTTTTSTTTSAASIGTSHRIPTSTPISVRTLLTMNLSHYKHKYIPALSCVVVNKQLLSVEYKNSANNSTSTTNTNHTDDTSANNTLLTTLNDSIKPKKRRLETQYSVCEEMDYGERLNKTGTDSDGVMHGSHVGVGGIYDNNLMYEQNVVYNATHATVTYTTPYEHYTTNTTTTNTMNNSNTNTAPNIATTANTTSTTNSKKCCLTIRDTSYPDTINLYLPLNLIDHVLVGNVVVITELFACIPESKKKMYLKVAEGNKTSIDVLGLVQGTQLHTLCDHSRTIPDPRYIDTMYTTLCSRDSVAYSGSGTSSGTGRASVKVGNLGTATYHLYKNSTVPYSKQRIYEHYIQSPPAITIAALTPQCLYNRAVYSLTGQVTYIRKLHITLRCTNCNSGVKKTTRLGGYMCTKCTSIYTIKPLWEVYIAFDDGTGECNMHIEGEQVYPLIRARYDSSGKVLSQVRRLVDDYVYKYGSLMYDAFDHSVSEYNKPYSEVVGEKRCADSTNATSTSGHRTGPNSITETTTTPVQYNTRNNPIFDMPLSERTKRLVAHIDLNTNNTNAKVPLILRSYVQLVSYSTQYSVYCRVDYNTNSHASITVNNTSTSSTTSTTTTTTAATTKTKREVKLQRNNAEKPYLAYFVSRPTYSGAKLSVQGLYVRELHGEGLNSMSWELLNKLKQH